MDVRESLVDTSWSATLVRPLRGFDEVTQDFTPVHLWSDEVLNSLSGGCTDSTPSTTVRVDLVDCILHSLL